MPKFIDLNLNGRTYFIEIHKIVSIHADGNESKIYVGETSTDFYYRCNETPKQILKKIKESEDNDEYLRK